MSIVPIPAPTPAVPIFRKSEGAKAAPDVPRAEYKTLTGRILAELAASRGITEATLLSEFRSGLQAHEGRAEDKLDKELAGWLVKFAQAVDKNEICRQAWEELKSKRDASSLVQHLYLFTYFGKTTADVLQDAFRFLRQGLDGLLPKYRKIYEETSALFGDPKLQLLSVLSEAMPQVFAEPLHSIAMAELALKATRDLAETMSSYKTDAHDFHLFAMAASVRAATGQYHFSELATLVEAARVAHGGRYDPIDANVLKRRVERYAKRMNLSRQSARNNKK